MPEKETLHANTAQILRNIEVFRERLRNGKERFRFVSDNQEIEQDDVLEEQRIEQVPENANREIKSFINQRGRGYAPHFTWGVIGPTTFNDGGNI